MLWAIPSIIEFVILLLLMILFSVPIFKEDMEDGSLALLFTQFDTISIIIAKFCTISTIAFISVITLSLIILILDSLFPEHSSQHFSVYMSAKFMFLLNINAILILLASIYISFSWRFIIILYPLVLLLLIPHIITAILLTYDSDVWHILIIFNIVMIIITLILSSRLIKNIYNTKF